MEWTEFVRLLQFAPVLFGALILRQRREDSAELRQKILAFYKHLGTHKKFALYRAELLPFKRVQRFAFRAGLEFEDATLPLALYEDYFSGQYHADQPITPYSEEEVRCWLTAAGSTPIEWWFLIAGEFRLWNPRDGEFHYIHTLDGDPRMEVAKADYLRSIGSAFDSMSAACVEATKRGLYP
jgi:hypothetical protein